MWEDSMPAEGWGLYAEALMAEPQPAAPDGFYTPEERLYQLQGKLYRDLRVRIDTGIHTGRMSYDDAVDAVFGGRGFPAGLVRAPGAKRSDAKRASCESAERAIFRYSKWPTQAITYRLGKDQIYALREEAAKALGDKFSAKTFHLAFMQQGTIPVGYFHDQLLSGSQESRLSRGQRTHRRTGRQPDSARCVRAQAAARFADRLRTARWNRSASCRRASSGTDPDPRPRRLRLPHFLGGRAQSGYRRRPCRRWYWRRALPSASRPAAWSATALRSAGAGPRQRRRQLLHLADQRFHALAVGVRIEIRAGKRGRPAGDHRGKCRREALIERARADPDRRRARQSPAASAPRSARTVAARSAGGSSPWRAAASSSAQIASRAATRSARAVSWRAA